MRSHGLRWPRRGVREGAVYERQLETCSGGTYSLTMSSGSKRIELGQYIVVDPKICHGKPTFKGTRVFVADVLADVERGLSWDFIVQRWGSGKIGKAAVAEAVRLARNALLAEDGRLASLPRAA